MKRNIRNMTCFLGFLSALLLGLGVMGLHGAEPALPEGVSKDELRAEIMRRQAVLIARTAEDVLPLLTEMAGAKAIYGKLAGEYLVFVRHALEKVYYTDELLIRMEELHKEHAELKQEAEREGVLVSDQVASEIRNGDSTGKIYGIPRDAMTFDSTKARIADQYREGQWAIIDTYAEYTRQYETKYSAAWCTEINKVLDRRYDLIENYRGDHEGRRKQLRLVFAAGTHDAWLGTDKTAEFARLREPTFRLEADDLPGMRLDLPMIRHYRLPGKITAPKAPSPFALKYDGQKILELKLAADLQSARADEQMLLLQKLYPALKAYDVVRMIASAPGQPFVESFSDENLTSSQALVKSLYGFGKIMSFDMVVGTYDAAERMLDRALSVDEGIQGTLDAFKDLVNIGEADGRVITSFAELLTETPETAEEKLAYLDRLENYRKELDASEEAQSSLNAKIDKTAEAAMDALALYMAGKGIKKGLDALKSNRGEQFLEYKETLKKRAEITRQATELLADESLVRKNPEVAEAARNFLESQKKFDKAYKTQTALETELAGKQPQLPQPKTSTTQTTSVPSETTSTQVLKTAEGREIVVKGSSIKGGVGEVRVLEGGDKIIKTFQDVKSGRDTITGKVNFERELKGTELLDDADTYKIVEKGYLEDGTPYMIKERFIKKSEGGNTVLLDEWVAENPGKPLPLEYQKATLDLMQKYNKKGIIYGDAKPDNIVIEELPNGSVKAKFVEGDFTFKADDWTPGDVFDKQVAQMTSKGLDAKAVSYKAGNNTRGQFKGLFDENLLETTKNNYKAALETENAANTFKGVFDEKIEPTELPTINDEGLSVTESSKNYFDETVEPSKLPTIHEDGTITSESSLNLSEEMSRIEADTKSLDLPSVEVVDPGSISDPKLPVLKFDF